MALTADQEQYLREHTLAVLGTGRGDGSPQLSMIIYDYDGNDADRTAASRPAAS